MNIGEKLKARRKDLGLTMLQVAIKVGVSEATVSRWESGDIANMRRDKIVSLANALEVSPSFIMDTGDVFAFDNIMPIKTYKLPLIGTIACGAPILAEQNIEKYIDTDSTVKADFCLRCKGDSMINVRIFDGDIVYIRQQPDVENGEIAAVCIDDEATLKRVYKYPNRLELRPENPTFPVLNYEGSELENIRIIGKAVAFLSGVR